jgi:CubicO group peptidase (beta-lactamase class C family)
MNAPIGGLCPPQYSAVYAAFEANFERGEELGARFCLTVDGDVVVDLIGGWADRGREAPFTAQSLAPIHSTTKAVTSLMIARLVASGRLDYGQSVASLWPEFGQAGKQDITVEQALSHQAGLAGFLEPMDPALWFDWDAICAKIAAMAPLWPPGTASGYHPMTFGYIAGEIFRRVDGRTLGRALAEDLAGPMDLDAWIGLPQAEHGRMAQIMKPRELPRFGEPNEALKAAFQSKWSTASGRSTADWLTGEFPAANGVATAEALAQLMAILATDASGMAKAASAERIRGQDLVLPFELSWGAGFLRNPPNMFFGPGEQAFGHYGRGGSAAFADPERGLSGAYVMTRESAHIIGDPRAVALIEAAYASL